MTAASTRSRICGSGSAISPPTSRPVDLRRFDAIVVNSSAGKDSQVALDAVAHAARDAGVLDRVTVLHCELGDVEWPGVPELAARQAAHYGLPFVVRRRERGGLLDLIRARGQFPSHRVRFCTSSTKREPARRYLTQLVRDLHLDRPARILNCLGLRAQESPARARRAAFAFDPGASNLTRRHVWTWLPVHHWTEVEVWQRIHASGVPYHDAYRWGMRRLSCSMCPLAARADVIRACQLRPDLARRYLALEREIGSDFRPGLSMRAAYTQAAATAGPLDPITSGIPLRLGVWSP